LKRIASAGNNFTIFVIIRMCLLPDRGLDHPRNEPEHDLAAIVGKWGGLDASDLS
jgi:hypothetical protein